MHQLFSREGEHHLRVPVNGVRSLGFRPLRECVRAWRAKGAIFRNDRLVAWIVATPKHSLASSVQAPSGTTLCILHFYRHPVSCLATDVSSVSFEQRFDGISQGAECYSF
jgi:hypothetical protein